MGHPQLIKRAQSHFPLNFGQFTPPEQIWTNLRNYPPLSWMSNKYFQGMKTPVTTVLSIAGVLVAGVAAAAVNTQALASRADSTVGEATASLVVDTQVTQTPAPTPASTDTNVSDPSTSVATPEKTVTTKSTSSAKPATSVKVASNSNSKVNQEDDDNEDSDDEEGDDLD
jgi:hypothetical protein